MQSNFWLNRTISITDQAILSTVRSKTLICLNANTNKNITLNKIEPYVSNHASVISSFKCLSLKKKKFNRTFDWIEQFQLPTKRFFQLLDLKRWFV